MYNLVHGIFNLDSECVDNEVCSVIGNVSMLCRVWWRSLGACDVVGNKG